MVTTEVQITDYRNSYIINSSEIDGRPCNTCRTQPLAGCQLIDDVSGKTQTYYLGRACIGEHMYLDGGIAQVPTSEVCIIFGDQRYKLLKKSADHRDDVVQIAQPDDEVLLFGGRTAVWTDLRFEIKQASATRLDTVEAVIRATEQLRPIVAQTVIDGAGGTSRVALEYPIPYMNFAPDGKAFQIDVGPTLFAGTTGDIACGIEEIEMAYIMYSDTKCAEFAVRVPTLVGPDGGAQTLHYSEIVHTDACSTLYCIND
jgi:hypothetical protein